MLAAESMVAKAVSGGRLTAADVAEKTFQAIRDEQFYILTHPRFMPLVQARLNDIGALRNPGNRSDMKG